MSTRRATLLTPLLLLVLFLGCAYDKISKSSDFDLKYEKAKDYYNKGDYAKALPLLDQLLKVKIGTPLEKEIRYYSAYCYYGQGDFLTASGLFKQVFSLFPQAPEAEECLYRSALCLYLASPRYQLDQTFTQKAIDAFQYFVNVYPKSSLVANANEKIDACRAKLETKMIASADLYFKTEHYEAAAISYENVLQSYPDTKNAEDIALLIIRSYVNYAGQSVTCRKPERYDKAIASYANFAERYPDSKKLPVAEALKERADDLKQKALNEIQTYKLNCDEYQKN